MKNNPLSRPKTVRVVTLTVATTLALSSLAGVSSAGAHLVGAQGHGETSTSHTTAFGSKWAITTGPNLAATAQARTGAPADTPDPGVNEPRHPPPYAARQDASTAKPVAKPSAPKKAARKNAAAPKTAPKQVAKKPTPTPTKVMPKKPTPTPTKVTPKKRKHSFGSSFADRVKAAVYQIPDHGRGATFHPYRNPTVDSWGVTSMESCVVCINPDTPYGDVVSVVDHEYGHVLQCRAYGGNVSAIRDAVGGQSEVERIADAVALDEGATWTNYTQHPTSREREAARNLLAGKKMF